MMVFFIAFLSLCAWAHLLFFRGGFWRADQRLDDAPAPLSWPEVIALIPARNEAETIGDVINAHLSANYPGKFSVLLVDDSSSDGTAEIARRAAASAPEAAHRFHLVSASPLRAGWSGKVWAMAQGLAAAKECAPAADYVLFCDADIVVAPDTLRRTVAKAEREKLALTSLMARLDARAQWGGILIPAFIYFFQKLYPFALVNDPVQNTAAAAGGFMLARKDALAKTGGVAGFKDALIDDCALARRMKDISPMSRIWLGLADDEAVSRRDNRALPSVWNMVARTAYAQLGYSPVLLVGAMVGMALIYLAPPLIALTFAAHGGIGATLLALSAWGLMAYSYWPTLKLYDREPWEAALLPVAAGLYTAMTFSSAQRHWRGKGGQWKGRTY